MCSKKVGMRRNMLNHCPDDNRWPLPWKQKCRFDRELTSWSNWLCDRCSLLREYLVFQIQSIHSSRIWEDSMPCWELFVVRVQVICIFLKTWKICYKHDGHSPTLKLSLGSARTDDNSTNSRSLILCSDPLNYICKTKGYDLHFLMILRDVGRLRQIRHCL